jgi:hypothetical protein
MFHENSPLHIDLLKKEGLVNLLIVVHSALSVDLAALAQGDWLLLVLGLDGIRFMFITLVISSSISSLPFIPTNSWCFAPEKKSARRISSMYTSAM